MNARLFVILGVVLGVLNTSDAQASRGGQHRGEWSIGWVHVVTPETAPLYDGEYGAIVAVSRTEPTDCLQSTAMAYEGLWQPVAVTLDEFEILEETFGVTNPRIKRWGVTDENDMASYGYVAGHIEVKWTAPGANCAREAVDHLLEEITNN